jgi:perosamine synthetase
MTARRDRIAVSEPLLDGNERRYVLECIDTNWVSSLGTFVSAFEDAFAAFCGVRHAVATNSGTAALHLALAALGIGPGDEVIVPSLTFVATANAVRYCGAVPVLADSDPLTLNIDPDDARACITERTAAIVPVHLFGQTADMDPLLALAREYDLFVVEDACEAHGARYKGRRAGALGHCAAFSFYGNKIITTGEGGMITTDDAALAETMRLYRGQGMDPDRRYWFPVVGYNYRMTNIAAAIGLAQLERIDHHLAARRRVAAVYEQALAPLADRIERPHVADWAEHAYWMYTIAIGDAAPARRDDVAAALAANGIETRPVFHPMHRLPPYAEDARRFPNAERASARGLCLPTHAGLDDEDIRRVTAALGKVLG